MNDMASTEQDLSTTTSNEDQGEKSKAVDENTALPQESQPTEDVEVRVED